MNEVTRTKYEKRAEKAIENLAKIVDEIDKNLFDKSRGSITQRELGISNCYGSWKENCKKISNNAENNLLQVMRKQEKRKKAQIVIK